MSHEVEIHQAQTQILRELLFLPKAGFAQLQKPTGLTSDHFKFHIKRLVELGFVEKLEDGLYRLTTAGKEYSNRLDTDNRTIERQPKSAVILVIEKFERGKSYLLLQERLKHPYYGFWGFPSGKIRWGETIMLTAERELQEETGLSAKLEYRGIYHEQVVEKESGKLLEDKIFNVIYGSEPSGKLLESFDGGRNCWMTLDEAHAQEHRYVSFDIEASVVNLKQPMFLEAIQYYSKQEF